MFVCVFFFFFFCVCFFFFFFNYYVTVIPFMSVDKSISKQSGVWFVVIIFHKKVSVYLYYFIFYCFQLITERFRRMHTL